MPENHAFLSPSGAKLWLQSPACWFTPAPAQTDKELAFYTEYGKKSTASEEGTLGHEIVEATLRRELKDEPYYKEHVKSPLFRELRKSEYYSHYLQSLADWSAKQTLEVLDEYDGELNAVYFEKQVKASSIHPELWGTSDVIIVAGDVLHIVDYKFGRLPIHADNNPQLKIYAYAALDTLDLWDTVKVVRATIIQPRDHDRDDTTIRAHRLRRWGLREVKPKALQTANHEGDFEPSLATCRYCKHRVTDKKHRDMFIESMGGWDKLGIRPNKLDKEEIKKIVEYAPAIKQWLDDVLDYATAQALDGQKLEGLKLIKGQNRRRFTNEKAVRRKLKRLGYEPKEYLKPKPLDTLTNIEALVGKTVFERDFAKLVYTATSKPKLVSESSKGLPAVTQRKQLEDDFADFTK